MGNSCIICPLYMKERDYNYAVEFYKSKLELGIDVPIYYIFSYKEHVDKFNEKFKKEFGFDYDNYILVPETFLQYKCQVTTKKLYGVKMLQDKYRYIGVVDCECLFIKKCNVDDKFKEIWSERTVMAASKSYLLRSLLYYCINGLAIGDVDRIKQNTDNYVYNCWFNDIPVYNTEYTAGFFRWLESQDIKRILDSFYMVDYYLFLLYMMDKYGWTIKKIDTWSPVGLMEEIAYSHPHEVSIYMNEIGTHWTSKLEKSNERTFLLFHRDHNPSEKEFFEFMQYSKTRYRLGIVAHENRKIIGVFNKIATKIWKTTYYLKYRW